MLKLLKNRKRIVFNFNYIQDLNWYKNRIKLTVSTEISKNH